MVVEHVVRNQELDRLAAEEKKRKKACAHWASLPASWRDVLLNLPLKSSGEMRQSVGYLRQSVGGLKMQFAAQAAKSDALLCAIVVLGLGGLGLQLARRWQLKEK
jgi:hypothetical protein